MYILQNHAKVSQFLEWNEILTRIYNNQESLYEKTGIGFETGFHHKNSNKLSVKFHYILMFFIHFMMIHLILKLILQFIT